MLSPDRIPDLTRLTAAAADYDIVRRAIGHIREHWRSQPEIEAIAEAAGVTPTELHHLFRRWAGITPKAFLQALTLDSARQLLRDSVNKVPKVTSFDILTPAASKRWPRTSAASFSDRGVDTAVAQVGRPNWSSGGKHPRILGLYRQQSTTVDLWAGRGCLARAYTTRWMWCPKRGLVI